MCVIIRVDDRHPDDDIRFQVSRVRVIEGKIMKKITQGETKINHFKLAGDSSYRESVDPFGKETNKLQVT